MQPVELIAVAISIAFILGILLRQRRRSRRQLQEAHLLAELAALQGETLAKEISILQAKDKKQTEKVQQAQKALTAKDAQIAALRSHVDQEDGMRRAMINILNDAKEARSLAEKANASKGQFLANMSHEIRTPLNGITGMMQLMSDTNLSEQQSDWVDTTQRASAKLLSIIEGMLDFSTLEARDLELELQPFDLGALVAETSRIAAQRLDGKPIQISSAIDPLLPALLLGDRLRIKQILLNLACNAVKFTESGQVAIKASLRRRIRDRVSLEFSVADTGIGIAAEKRGDLFKPFSQVDESHTRKHEGTGLGLAIARRLVDLMGGEIGVESDEGKGSRFWFRITLATSTQGPCASALATAGESLEFPLYKPRKPSSPAAPSLPRRRVLVVDDNKINRKVATRFLDKMGCVAEEACDGLEAVAKVKSNRYDIVLMDCQMPVLDGYDATLRIRANESETHTRTPIIALTANAMEHGRSRSREVGMDDYLTKPVKLDTLRKALERHLDSTRTKPPPPLSYAS